MKNGWQRFAASRSVSNAPKGYRRYHASLAVAAASVAAASVKPAAPTMSSLGEVRLGQHGSEQQSSCGSPQNLSYPGPSPIFA